MDNEEGALKILIVTPYRLHKTDWYDYFATNSDFLVRLVFPMKTSFTLRFIKQNIPEIHVMEYPLWEEYTAKVDEGWDVVGFSFYTSHVPRILQMADYARRRKIPRLWAGNYGALDPGLSAFFDRVFTGYSEHQLAELLGKKIERLRHPPLINQWWLSPIPFRMQRVGVLFTQRGCPHKCSFCQTPLFSPGLSPIPLESIEEVLRYYKHNGVDWIGVIDENFGILKAHSQRVVELIQRYGLYWSPMTNAAIALENLDDWNRTGLMGPGIGIESVRSEHLQSWNKKVPRDAVQTLVEELHRRGRYFWGFHIIGHEQDTEESIRSDIEALAGYDIDYLQTTILTPFPGTPLWEHLENQYGIFETDWSKWDTKNLVWNHPHLTPAQMKKLLSYSFKRLGNSLHASKMIWRIVASYAEHQKSYLKAFYFVSKFPLKSFRYPQETPYLQPLTSGGRHLQDVTAQATTGLCHE